MSDDAPKTPRVEALAAVLSDAAPLPWERQKGETEEEYELFKRYRDRKPPRGRVIGPGMGDTAKVFRMFQDGDWKGRVTAWDRYLERITLEERVDVVKRDARACAAEHLDLTHNLYEVALNEARKLLRASQESEGAGLVVKPAELIKLTQTIVTLERLILGESTQIVETKGPDMSALSLDELEQLEALQRKIQDSETGGGEPH